MSAIPAIGGMASWALSQRFGATRAGRLRLISAVIDPYLYALAFWVAVWSTRGRDDFDSYMLVFIGCLAFYWTAACALRAFQFFPLLDLLAPRFRMSALLWLVAVMTPPTATIAGSAAIMFLLRAIWPGEGSFANAGAAAWPFVVQGLWTGVLALGVAKTARSRTAWNYLPPVAIVVGVGIVMPILYRLEPASHPISLLLTSYNPIAHVLAAYYNALWYAAPISFQVLPAATVAGLAALWMADRALKCGSVPHDPLLAPLDPELWRDRPLPLSGRELTTFLVRARTADAAKADARVDRIGRLVDLGPLWDQRLRVYPDWAALRLAYALALALGADPRDVARLRAAADPPFVAKLDAEGGRGLDLKE